MGLPARHVESLAVTSSDIAETFFAFAVKAWAFEPPRNDVIWSPQQSKRGALAARQRRAAVGAFARHLRSRSRFPNGLLVGRHVSCINPTSAIAIPRFNHHWQRLFKWLELRAIANHYFMTACVTQPCICSQHHATPRHKTRREQAAAFGDGREHCFGDGRGHCLGDGRALR